MFKWINNWFNKKVQNAWEEARNQPMPCDDSMKMSNPLSSNRNRGLDQSGMNFTIYNAVGGHVMEYSFYDERTDNNTKNLHVINADADLGQSIAHIITYEMLRK